MLHLCMLVAFPCFSSLIDDSNFLNQLAGHGLYMIWSHPIFVWNQCVICGTFGSMDEEMMPIPNVLFNSEVIGFVLTWCANKPSNVQNGLLFFTISPQAWTWENQRKPGILVPQLKQLHMYGQKSPKSNASALKCGAEKAGACSRGLLDTAREL